MLPKHILRFSEIEGISEVIVYPATEDPERRKNRGFCFLEFGEHKYASAAKRKLSSMRSRPFNRDIYVDWAEPQEDVDDEALNNVSSFNLIFSFCTILLNNQSL